MMIFVDFASIDKDDKPDLVEAKKPASDGSRLVGVGIRATYGTWEDPTIAHNWADLKAADLMRLAYLFPRYDQKPADQVKAFVNVMKPRLERTDFAPYQDIEFPPGSNMTPAAGFAFHQEIWNRLADAFGVPPGLYISARVENEDLFGLWDPKWDDSWMWIAKPWPWAVQSTAQRTGIAFAGGKWNPLMSLPAFGDAGNWELHQYQGDALRCPGFSNTVDLSRFHLMSLGASGARVKRYQRRLGIPQTGVYDDAMKIYVVAFQTTNRLVPDGIIGPRTSAVLSQTPIPG